METFIEIIIVMVFAITCSLGLYAILRFGWGYLWRLCRLGRRKKAPNDDVSAKLDLIIAKIDALSTQIHYTAVTKGMV